MNPRVVFWLAVGLYLLWGPLPDFDRPSPKSYGGIARGWRFGVFRYAAIENHTYSDPYRGPPITLMNGWRVYGGGLIEMRQDVEYPVSLLGLLQTAGTTLAVLAVARLYTRPRSESA